MSGLFDFTSLGVRGYQPIPGQYPGTTTSDAATTGNVGESFQSWSATDSGVTITIASPAVFTFGSTTVIDNGAMYLTTTGALPTGLSINTTYYVVAGSVGGGGTTCQLTTTIGGAAINTSGSQSGTHTAHAGTNTVTVTNADICAVNLTAGDWDVRGFCSAFNITSNQAVISANFWLNTTSATIPTGSNLVVGWAGNATNNWQILLPVAPTRFSLAASGTIYLSGIGAVGSGNVKLYGSMLARRAR